MNIQREDSPLIPPVTEKRTYNNPINSSRYESCTDSPTRFKTYRRRWYILAMYTAIGLMCNFDWNTWGPISEACEIMFGWRNWQVLFITSWAAISLFLGAFPSTWMIDKKGLRASVILCAFLMTVGKVFQVIPCSNPLTRTILLNIGQCITMLSCPVGLGAPPSVSATWFPPEERTTATAILTLLPFSGSAGAFVLGPYMVPLTESIVPINSSITNHTTYDIEIMNDHLTKYMGAKLGISGLLLVCVLVHFPNKPPLPPCATSSSYHKKHSYTQNIKKIMCDGSYLFLGLIFSLTYGVIGGWIAVLSVAIKPFGIDEYLSGWLGCAAVISGIFSGICLARVVDYVKRHTKTVLILLFIGTSISQLVFTLTCSRIIAFSRPLLFSSIILGGFFVNATTPLLFEMAVETVYPIAEGLTAIVLLVMGNSIYLLIMIMFMFPIMKVEWINWATVVSNGLCVPGLLLFKNKFKRLELD